MHRVAIGVQSYDTLAGRSLPIPPDFLAQNASGLAEVGGFISPGLQILSVNRVSSLGSILMWSKENDCRCLQFRRVPPAARSLFVVSLKVNGINQ
jgi:hypothetical protein